MTGKRQILFFVAVVVAGLCIAPGAARAQDEPGSDCALADGVDSLANWLDELASDPNATVTIFCQIVISGGDSSAVLVQVSPGPGNGPAGDAEAALTMIRQIFAGLFSANEPDPSIESQPAESYYPGSWVGW